MKKVVSIDIENSSLNLLIFNTACQCTRMKDFKLQWGLDRNWRSFDSYSMKCVQEKKSWSIVFDIKNKYQTL